jgi:hypothetical protein
MTLDNPYRVWFGINESPPGPGNRVNAEELYRAAAARRAP